MTICLCQKVNWPSQEKKRKPNVICWDKWQINMNRILHASQEGKAGYLQSLSSISSTPATTALHALCASSICPWTSDKKHSKAPLSLSWTTESYSYKKWGKDCLELDLKMVNVSKCKSPFAVEISVKYIIAHAFSISLAYLYVLQMQD